MRECAASTTEAKVKYITKISAKLDNYEIAPETDCSVIRANFYLTSKEKLIYSTISLEQSKGQIVINYIKSLVWSHW